MKTGNTPAPAVLDKNGIQTLIPHSGRMCLLDSVSAWDAVSIECVAVSHRAADNPLRSADMLPVQAGIEYAAQAMAVHGGLSAPADGGPRRGYLAVLTDIRWSVARLDDVPAPLRVRARKQTAIAGGSCYDFTVSEGERVLVAGTAVVALEAGAGGDA